MIIRQERPEEFAQIYDLVKVAFQTAEVTNGREQDFVNLLRSGPNYIPELALVAEEDAQLIGHIMLTKTYIVNDKGKIETLLLAPISIALEHRNTGAASDLIKASFKLAGEMGYTSVLLVGNPAFYHRFGFKAAINFGIKHEPDIPDENVMACELHPDAFLKISGMIDFR
jgi:predicted N-acetyltransferase YhbS